MKRFSRERLKALRKARRIKQKDVAKALNIKVSTLSAYENGYAKPSADMLLTLLDFYQVTNHEIAETSLNAK